MEGLPIGSGEGVVKSILGKLGSFLLSEALLIGSVREDIGYIRDELQSMDAAVRDLIHAELLNHQNKVWILHVLQVACDAELCIDEFVDCLGGYCGHGVIGTARRAARFISTVGSRYRIAKRIRGLKTRAMEVSARRSRYITTIQTKVPDLAELIALRGSKAEPHGMQYYHSISEDELVGIEISFKQLKEKLKDSSIKVIAIYGRAGSGKTALAKMVYRRRNSPDLSFQSSAWVTLPNELDTQRVLVDILRQVTGLCEGMENHEIPVLSEKLKEHLTQQSTLLILDSLWSKENWDKIKSILPEIDHLKGKILITTREKDVAEYCCNNRQLNLIEVKPLTFKNSMVLCFRLFFNPTAVMLSRWYMSTTRSFFFRTTTRSLKCFTFVLGNLMRLLWKFLQLLRRCLEVVRHGFNAILTYLPYGENVQSSCDKIFKTIFLHWIPLIFFILFINIFILFMWVLELICFNRDYFKAFLEKIPLNVKTYFKSIEYSMALSFSVPMEYKFLCGAQAGKSVDHHTVDKLFNSLSWLSQDRGLLEVPKCCYYNMSSSLQECARDLSIFPECYVINRKKITSRWVALGLVSPASGLSREEVAESYFGELVTRGFIEPESATTCGKIKYCRINSFFKELLTRINPHDNQKTSYRDVESCQLYDVKPSDALKCFRERLSNKNPKSLIFLDLEGCKGLKRKELNLVCKFVNLKFLSLRNTDVCEIPQKIRKLNCLETLDIRQTGIRKVPKDILDLHHLKHLLAGCISKPESSMGDLKLSTSPVEMPAGMEEMSSLETLAYVDATRSSNLLISMRELTQLKKLGLVIREQNLNSKPLCISLMMLSASLLSLSIFDERAGGLLEFLDYLSFVPLKLKKLTLRGYLGRLPPWIGDHKCHTKLSIADTRLWGNAIKLIGKIPTLLCLKLYSNSYEEQDLTLANKEFPVLRVLIIQCDVIQNVSFKKGATPRLEIFRWLISKTSPMTLYGIDNLLMLKEISLIGDIDPQLQQNITNEVKNHPNHETTLVFEKIDQIKPEPEPEEDEKKGIKTDSKNPMKLSLTFQFQWGGN